tara:strand:+ start:556 stop:1098 length:543 start_codon:yes stop_codon:yes gene_type:complete
MILVELYPWEYEWASHVGARRFIENWGKRDAVHYDKKRMEDDRTAQVAACVGELAVAKIINQYWSGHVWHKSDHAAHKHLPDVGTNIEVRRVRTSTNAAVRKRQLNQGLILFVVQPVPPEFKQVNILGWMDHDEAWEKGEPSHYSPEDTRVINAELLNPVTSFTNKQTVIGYEELSGIPD